ncbi:MAG: carbohydrate binding family 9 domain-containing protein [Ignavibacteria bacterium]|nr:carbohydrate binding family 9 domain-containing protein [Ignavibacteria bacterium]
MILILIAIICGFLHSPFIQAEGTRQNADYVATTHRITTHIQVDANLDKPEWVSTPRYELKYERNPGENIPARVRTYFSSCYDSDNLYFAFYCYDSSTSEIRAHLSERDKVYNDDYVVVCLDPFQDNQRVYEFLVNPLGVQADLLMVNGNEDDTYDLLWHSAGKRTDYGYCVEMAIPFKSLRFPVYDVQDWNLFVGRTWPRQDRTQFSWTPVNKNNPCFMCQSGILTGLENVKQPLLLEVLPYFASFQKSEIRDDNDPSSGLVHHDLNGRYGVGVKVSPSSLLVMEGVVNPDFSQVESDAQQISVNSTFALYYNEKRPFFLEGNEIFSTYMNAYYSRTINNPLYAFKFTGKNGKLSYGVITARDQNSPFIIPGEEGSNSVSTDLYSQALLARARYDLGQETYFGVLFAGRFMDGAKNIVGGFDFRYLFWDNYYLRGQYLFSHTKELNDTNLFSESRTFGNTGHDAAFNGESYNGGGFRFGFSRYTRHVQTDLIYRDVTPAFQDQLGFITNTNSRNIQFENVYIFYPESGFISSGNIFCSQGLTFNHEHVHKETYIVLGGNLNLKGQIYFNFNGMPVNNEIYNGVAFTGVHRGSVNITARPVSGMTIGFYGTYGHYIHRDDNPEVGKGYDLEMDLSVRLTRDLEVSTIYLTSHLDALNRDELFYDQYIINSTTTYQFTKETSARIILEYNSDGKTLNIFPLFSYKINPFTIFYAGCTSGLQHYEGHTGFIQNERQFFLKLQYLWAS